MRLLAARAPLLRCTAVLGLVATTTVVALPARLVLMAKATADRAEGSAAAISSVTVTTASLTD